MKHSLIPVILCGGSGTRLWPMSRDTYPKQFLSFSDNSTMLQQTISRLDGFISPDVNVSPDPVIICNEDHRFLVTDQVDHSCNASIILEPCARNTAPALTVAVIKVTRDGSDPLLLVMPSDHAIKDLPILHQAINNGIPAALDGAIVTFGIVPDRPETGYGYIQASQIDSETDHIFRVARFIEKPEEAKARSFLANGGYYWNSGMFLLRATSWAKAMHRFQSTMWNACNSALEHGSIIDNFHHLDRDFFHSCPSDSIDYAIMEKIVESEDRTIAGMVVPLDAGWSDLGSWDSVWKIGSKDTDENNISGDVIVENTRKSLIISTSRMVSCIGVENLVVIETPDVIMIADLTKVQDIKKIVNTIKEKNRKEATSHRKELRPWGWYDCLELGPNFQVKRISVNPGGTLSLQSHKYRGEHWVVTKGTAQVTLGEKKLTLQQNESIYIPVNTKHRVANVFHDPLEFIEVQSGSYLGEDDITRYEDIYGRL